MKGLRVNKLLVFYTLLVFFIGVFSAGFYLTVNGYDVPWSTIRSARAELMQNEENTNTNTAILASLPIEENTVEQIVDRVGPAVVKIETMVKVENRANDLFMDPFDDPFFREFFGDRFRIEEDTPQTTEGLGSGFIISPDGYILTNNHVIEGADEIKVYLTSRQEPYIAKVVGSDADLDLAVVKIEAGQDLPVLKLGDSNAIKVGNWVIAIGNPYGLDHTVTVGVISAKGRPIILEEREFKDLIQTDASINPGNSGGPLLNLKGEVIGINTAINAQAQGIGFAIASSTVQQVLDELIEKGKVVRPWLGVYMQPVTDDLVEHFGLNKAEGALITSVLENSPAEKAGLQRGDIILEYNKKHIATPEDLQVAVQETKIGDQVVLLVQRQNSAVYVTVKIEEKN